jgi:arylformamidase
MQETTITDWDDAYANAAYIEGAEHYPPRWAKEADGFRSSWSEKELDLSYGDGERQKFDIFHPTSDSEGLVVFVHGGYWMKFDKSSWSQLASGCLARGWTVCLPSYELAPSVQIAEITRQIGAAVQVASERISGPIRLTGHSAGGHLVARMLSAGTPLPASVLERVERVVSISGLHDLRPLRKTKMNEAFQLTEADAIDESPALMPVACECNVTAWVGAEERPEFIRQSALLAEAWESADFEETPGKHHFNVVEDLKDSNSRLVTSLLR